MPNNLKNEKYEFLYNYGRVAFDEELKRFQNIETKALRYLSFLSVWIVAYSYLLRECFSVFFPPDNPFRWLIVFTVFLTYCGLLSSWSQLYRGLRFSEMPRMPYNKKTIDFIDKNDFISVHYHLARKASEAVTEAQEKNLEKVERLTIGYRDLVFSTFVLTLSIVLIAGQSLYADRDAIMPDDNKGEENHSSPPSEPDRSLDAPDLVHVFEDYTPPAREELRKI